MGRAGELSTRVQIQRATVSYGETNQAVETWATIATRWASVEALSGIEAIRARALQAETTYKVTMRDGFDVRPADRIIDGSSILNVLSVIPGDERLTILAVEVLDDTYNRADLTLSVEVEANGTISQGD